MTNVKGDEMLGKRIASERRKLGLTQKDLAKLLGIGRSAVGMLETDRAPLDVHRLLELEKCGFDLLYILNGERSEVAATRFLNWELLLSIQNSVRRWTEDREVKIPSAKKALLLKLLYTHFVEHGKIDTQVIEDTLHLMAA